MLEWNKLSIKDKSAIMKMALLAGFTNINNIKELYNLYALGGMMNTNNPLPNFLGGRLPIPAVRYDEGGHLFDGSGNSKIHTASTIELALNRLKQEFLSSRGINVNVDGSWGPWLELLYRNLLAYRPSSSKTLLSLFYNNAARGNLYKTAAVRNAEDRTRRASKPFDARAYVNLGLVLLLDNTRHTPGEAKSTTSAYLLALLERKNELDLRAKWELEMKRVHGSSYLGNGKMLNPNYPTIYDKVNMTGYPLSYLALLSSFSPSYNQDISQELKEFLATKDKTLYGMALTLEPLLTYIPGNPMSGGALMAHANTDAMTMSAVADLPSIATSFIKAPIETAFGLGAGTAGSYYGGNYAADKWGEKARTAGELLGGIGFGTAAGLGARAARGVYNFGRDKYLGYTVAPDKTYRLTGTPEPSYTKEVPMIDKVPTGEVSEPSLVPIPTASTTPTNNIFTELRDRLITPTNPNPILTDTPLSLREARLYLVGLRGAKNRDEIDNIFTELRDRLITPNENIIPTLFKASNLHINTKVGYASEIAKQTLIPDQINNSYEVLRNNGLYPVTKKELGLFRKNELDLVNNAIELVRNDFLNNKLKLWDKRLDLWGAANEEKIYNIKLSLLNRMSPLQLPINLLPKKEYEAKRGKYSIGQYQPTDNEIYVKKLDMKKAYEPWINTLYHELNHAYDFNFNDAFRENGIGLEPLSAVLYENGYYENNPYSPLYREFEKSPNIVRNRGSWGGSPEEMTSEATNYTFKHSKNGKTVPYKKLSDKLKRRVIEDLSTRFEISIQNAKDILETMSKSGLVLNDTKSTNLLLYNTPTFYELLYTT